MASEPPVEWVDRFNGQPRKGCDILVQVGGPWVGSAPVA